MTGVKICGIKTREEALTALRAGAWAIGEVFAPSSRKVGAEIAADINYGLAGQILKIGVFVNEKVDEVKYIARYCSLDLVQLHGDERPEYGEELHLPIIKSFSVQGPVDIAEVQRWRAWAYLFDAFDPHHPSRGGSGSRFNWDYLKNTKGFDRIILAGGLKAENVADAIKKVRPMAVDVSSGVEFPAGGKDPEAIRLFMHKVRAADEDAGSDL